MIALYVIIIGQYNMLKQKLALFSLLFLLLQL